MQSVFESIEFTPILFPLIKKRIQEAIQLLDVEFCTMRKQEYLQGHIIDDGCTLNILLLINRWCISVHIGDSRSFISNSMGVQFMTVDHAVHHPIKSQFIHKNGGYFRNHTATKFKAFDESHYLVDARVRRRDDFNTEPFGLALKHMGLSDSLGDVVMKLDPPLFQCIADVEFLHLGSDENWNLFMATDGLWSCVPTSDPRIQCKIISDILNEPCTLRKLVYPPIGTCPSLMNTVSQLCALNRGVFNVFEPSGPSDDVVCLVVQVEAMMPGTPRTATATKRRNSVRAIVEDWNSMPTTPVL